MFHGSTSGNYTSLSFPVIGNSHQGNLQPPISRSGSWLLSMVEENPDVAGHANKDWLEELLGENGWERASDQQRNFITCLLFMIYYC